MAEPKVSIIIPVFNSSKYLKKCMDSVLAQSLFDIEIICGDGGSKDGSLEILRKYEKEDSRVRVIYAEGHGYGESLNECINLAKGEYIGIVESDDLIRPNAYATLYRTAKKHNLDWVRADIYFYYPTLPENEQLRRESIIYDGGFYNEVLNPQNDFRPYKTGLRTWSGIYKRDFLNQYKIEHNETPGGAYQDVGFYLKTLYYAQRVMFIDEPFYMWRQDNPDSTIHFSSSKLVQKSLNEWKLNRDYIDCHKELGRIAVGGYHYRKFYSYLWTLDLADESGKEEVRSVSAVEYAQAIENNEIEKVFFADDEWTRFIQFLKDIGIGTLIPNEWINHPRKLTVNLRGSIKRMLWPFSKLCRKILFKLMRDVMAWEYEQYQILLKTENEKLEKELQSLEQKTATHELLLSQFMEELRQKVHDQGEVLWAAKCRLEDVHKRTEETGQKVLEQGQVSWESRDRIEDIYLIVDSFLAHPQYGASKKSHNAVNMITSLLTLPAAEQRRTLCEQFLSSIEIETFSFCNRQCWFCPNHIVDRHSKNEYMDEAVYLKILSELREIHYTSKIAFSRYNEPFADRIILTRIRQAREYCPKAYLHSNTNGDYLSREYLDEIAHAGLDELEVQCYFGENENFSFTRYLERLESLAEKLCIRNYHIVEKKENDRFRAVLDYDGLRLTFFSLNMKEYANNRGETLEHTRVYQRKENCLVPFRKLYVDYNGSYVMCCNVRSDIKKHHDFVLGDAKKDSVFDVFCGEKMITIRKMVGSVCNLTAPCKSCQYLTVDDDFNIFKQEG